MGLLESLVSAEWVREQVLRHTFEFFVYTLVLAGMSYGLGYRMGRRAAARRDGGNDGTAPAPRLTPCKARRRIRSLTPEQRALLDHLRERGRVFTPELNDVSDGAYLLLSGMEGLGLVTHDTDVHDGTSWTLTPEAFDALSGSRGTPGV